MPFITTTVTWAAPRSRASWSAATSGARWSLAPSTRTTQPDTRLPCHAPAKPVGQLERTGDSSVIVLFDRRTSVLRATERENLRRPVRWRGADDDPPPPRARPRG